ncbi:MAG TPA: LysR family transcriptional regulator [Bryobacteraceae bacterium]|nr:LysR family transcriptional regulator [Bryobacteraceae bacterium]
MPAQKIDPLLETGIRMCVDAPQPEWINYHHLLYFRTVAREGSITKASAILGLAQPTISGQIRALEETLGAKLFMRKGRNLVMTEFGRKVFGFADQIFALGEEMGEALRGATSVKVPTVRIGASRSLSESTLRAFVVPLAGPGDGNVSCRTEGFEQLLAGLASRHFDLVFSDQAMGSASRAGSRTEILGSSDIAILGDGAVADRLASGFPQALADAPMVLPPAGSQIRVILESWFAEAGMRPHCVAELETESLMAAFAEQGRAVMAVPRTGEAELGRRYGLQLVGTLPGAQQKFYVTAPEASFSHPPLARIIDHARQVLSPMLAASC